MNFISNHVFLIIIITLIFIFFAMMIFDILTTKNKLTDEQIRAAIAANKIMKNGGTKNGQ